MVPAQRTAVVGLSAAAVVGVLLLGLGLIGPAPGGTRAEVLPRLGPSGSAGSTASPAAPGAATPPAPRSGTKLTGVGTSTPGVPSSDRSASTRPPQTSYGPAWTGQFAGFGGSAWKSAWGEAAKGAWGLSNVSVVSDPSAPGDGSVLAVYYGRGSSANSCSNCPTVGGAQFYTSFTALGHSDYANATVLDLKYAVKFDAGFDFGKAGKLPGLYGGVIGQESGGKHGNGWSTRYMWRATTTSPSQGEIYLYTPQATGYGTDYFGTWNWAGDGRWHTVEQQVDRVHGDVTVWYDGMQALHMAGSATGIAGIPFSGVFFSTFFGGHDTTWGPSKGERAYFADFSVSTSLQH